MSALRTLLMSRNELMLDLQLAMLTESEKDDAPLLDRLSHLDLEISELLLKLGRGCEASAYQVSMAWCLAKLDRKPQARNMLLLARRNLRSSSLPLLDEAMVSLNHEEEQLIILVEEPEAPAPDPEPAIELEPEDKPKPKAKKKKKKRSSKQSKKDEE